MDTSSWFFTWQIFFLCFHLSYYVVETKLTISVVRTSFFLFCSLFFVCDFIISCLFLFLSCFVVFIIPDIPSFVNTFLKLFLYYLLIIKLYVIIQIIYSKYKNRASTFSAICSHKTKKDPEESFPCCLQGSFFRILFS